MNQSTGIHCKVVCNDQIRRFQFSGTEFSSLQDQVKQLLGLNREFVLKYKDNEDDMITISSTEELACAIDISHKNDGGLIRLTVYPNEQPTFVSLNVPTQLPFNHPEPREFSHRGRGGGRGGKWGGRCAREGGGPAFHGEHGWKHRFEGGENPWRSRPDGEHGWKHHFEGGELPCRNRFEKRRAKLSFKRDLWKAYLNSLDQSTELTPEEERRKEFFQRKVERLDSILAEFCPQNQAEGPSDKQDVPPIEKTESCPQPEKPAFCPQKMEGGQSFEYGRRGKKCEKGARKYEKKEHKEGKQKEAKYSLLSEEAKAEIATLKKQIKEKKPALWALQGQLKAKKSELKAAKETGQKEKIPELKNEIGKLKQEKLEKKAQIEPLRQRVFLLKSGSK